jgi:hypothetical protein
MPVVAALIIASLSAFAEAWIVMLLAGAIHSEVSGLPAFSFWGALGLVVLINILLIPATSGRDS